MPGMDAERGKRGDGELSVANADGAIASLSASAWLTKIDPRTSYGGPLDGPYILRCLTLGA